MTQFVRTYLSVATCSDSPKATCLVLNTPQAGKPSKSSIDTSCSAPSSPTRPPLPLPREKKTESPRTLSHAIYHELNTLMPS